MVLFAKFVLQNEMSLSMKTAKFAHGMIKTPNDGVDFVRNGIDFLTHYYY